MTTYWQVDVQLYYQISFALYSVKQLRKNQIKSNSISTFFYIQNLLTSIANISKALQKTEEYRQYLGVELLLIPSVMNRRLRNINEHIEKALFRDENLSEHVSDMATGSFDIDLLEVPIAVRYFNTNDLKLQFLDVDSTYHSFSLIDIENELKYLARLKPLKYVFERYKGYDFII